MDATEDIMRTDMMSSIGASSESLPPSTSCIALRNGVSLPFTRESFWQSHAMLVRILVDENRR